MDFKFTLGGLLLFCGRSIAKEAAQVTWKIPSTFDTFSSDDLLNATWASTSKIISPSFQLCAVPANSTQVGGSTKHSRSVRRAESVIRGRKDYGSSWLDDGSDGASQATLMKKNDECGGAVWPAVESNSSGDYVASLSIPMVTSSSVFYLLMQSNFGDQYLSPQFHVISDDDVLLDPSINTLAGSSSSEGTSSPVSSDLPAEPIVALPSSTDRGAANQSASLGSSPSKPPLPSSSNHLLPIGPITPPNVVGSPLVPSNPYMTPFPTNPPTPGDIGGLNGPTVSPGGLSPAEAAAQAAKKSGHAIAAAIAVPLSLMCGGVLLGGLASLYLRRKKNSSGPYERRSGQVNPYALEDAFTRFHQHPYRSISNTSRLSSKSYYLDKNEKDTVSRLSGGQEGSIADPLLYQQLPLLSQLAVPSMYHLPLHSAAYPFAQGGYTQGHMPGGAYLPLIPQQHPASQHSSLSHIQPPVRLARTLTPSRSSSRVPSASSRSSASSYSTNSRSSAQSVHSESKSRPPPVGVTAIHDPIATPSKLQSSDPPQAHPWASLFPANSDKLTPPALPDTGTLADAKALAAYHGTMQTILNSYMEKVLPPTPQGGVIPNEGKGTQANRAPSINYSTRPPIDLDLRQ